MKRPEDERDIHENVARPGAQVAVKVPARLGAFGGAGHEPGLPPFAAGREAHAAYEFSQNPRCVVMAALHKTAEPIAAKGVRDVIMFDSVTEGARPASAK
jgi:hypothetical protein